MKKKPEMIPRMQKKMVKKIGAAIATAWNFLEGKKRRVALVAGFVERVTKPYTVINYVAQGVFFLFGGADVLSSSNKLLKKLPSGKLDE